MEDNNNCSITLEELFAQLEKRRDSVQEKPAPTPVKAEEADDGVPKWMIPSWTTMKTKASGWWSGTKEKAEKGISGFWEANPQTATNGNETLGEKLQRIKNELKAELKKCYR